MAHNLFERKVYPNIERRIARPPYDWFACPSEYSKLTMKAGSPVSDNCYTPWNKSRSFQHNTTACCTNETENWRKKFGLEGIRLFGHIGRLRIKSTTQSNNLVALLKAAKIVAGAGYEEAHGGENGFGKVIDLFREYSLC